MTRQTGLVAMAQAVADPLVQLRLVPAVAMAVALMVAIRICKGPTPVLVIILIAMASYYLISAGFGIDHARAIDVGLPPQVGQNVDVSLKFAMLHMIDWVAVAHVARLIASVVLLNLIGILSNTSGVEWATGEDVDENGELRVAGAANVVIGLFGGLTSYLQGGATILCEKLGVQRTPMIMFHCTTLLVACFLAPKMGAVVPSFIPAGLVMLIRMSMLLDLLLATRKRLVLIDWLIVAAMVLATAILGILPTIAVGLLLALLGFAYASIRLPVIRHTTTASQRRSARDRSAAQNDLLTQHGDQIRMLHLQGALFFGSVEQMITNLRGLADPAHGLTALILDCSDVNSFDLSACAALDKLSQSMLAQGIVPHVTGVSPRLRAVFVR